MSVSTAVGIETVVYESIPPVTDGEIEDGRNLSDVGQPGQHAVEAKSIDVSGKEKGNKSFFDMIGFSKEALEASAKENNAPQDMSYFALFTMFLWFGARAFGGR